MFLKLGRVIARHPWRSVAAWFVLLVVIGAGAFWGYGHGDVFDRLSNSVSLVPGTESDVVNELTTGAGGEQITIVVDGLDFPEDFTSIAAWLGDHRSELSDVAGVDSVIDTFSLLGPAIMIGPQVLETPAAQPALVMMSQEQDGFVMVATLDKDLDDAQLKAAHADIDEAVARLQTELRADYAESSVRVLSAQAVTNSMMDQIKTDLVRGEGVGIPVALILLIIVFGGILAAGLPIVGALVAIGVGMGVLWAMTFATTVEAFTINIASIIGLALSVDYGLLIVSRYREELAIALNKGGYTTDGKRMPSKQQARPIVRAAMEQTIRTAGRTVFYSALTIACAMCALLTMEASIMLIIGEAGIAVTLLAVLTAITLVPAIVVIMNRAMVKPSVITRIPIMRSIVKAVGDSASDHGFFSRLARGVHRRPWVIAAATAVVLAAMAGPLSTLQMRTTITDYLTEGASATLAYNTVQADYPALQEATIVVVADRPPDEVADLHDHLRDIDNVDYISEPTALLDDENRSVIRLHIDLVNQVGSEVTQVVKDLRAYDAGYHILVGGPAALQYDFVQSIIDRAPLALTVMVLAVFILMFLMTGSVVVPIKAAIINSFSLLASLGATTLIFMNGLFGMPKVLGMETFIVVCAICFGFGLAMDYEVFLIARVKEYWDKGFANDEAVERGLQRSGRIITSAAAIIVAVFIGFTFGDMVPIKEIGVALAITVITDATLVRMLLVPATMTILGKWNWWSPKPLRWVYEKLGIVH